MQDMDWLHNPAFENIHPQKLEIISELIHNTTGKPIAQSLPFLMQANRALQAEGLSFTKEESSLIMNILTKDMSEAEKQNLARMQGLIEALIKK